MSQFKYELRVIYTLNNSSLKIEYNIRNLENRKMYFSIGSHEGFYCPEGIEKYNVIFETPENLDDIICSSGSLSALKEDLHCGLYPVQNSFVLSSGVEYPTSVMVIII